MGRARIAFLIIYLWRVQIVYELLGTVYKSKEICRKRVS